MAHWIISGLTCTNPHHVQPLSRADSEDQEDRVERHGAQALRSEGGDGAPAPLRRGLSERQFFIDNLLVRIHFIIVMIRWTGLAPWEFEFPFPGSLTSTFLAGLSGMPRQLRHRDQQARGRESLLRSGMPLHGRLLRDVQGRLRRVGGGAGLRQRLVPDERLLLQPQGA